MHRILFYVSYHFSAMDNKSCTLQKIESCWRQKFWQKSICAWPRLFHWQQEKLSCSMSYSFRISCFQKKYLATSWCCVASREIILEQTWRELGQLKILDAPKSKLLQNGVLSGCVLCCQHILFCVCFSLVRTKLQ